jgi:hypothetical protein
MLGQPSSDPSSLLMGHIGVPNGTNGEMPMEMEKARQMERELAEIIRREQVHPPPTTIAALLEATTLTNGNSIRTVECNNEATPASSSAEPGTSNAFGNQKMEHFVQQHHRHQQGTEQIVRRKIFQNRM